MVIHGPKDNPWQGVLGFRSFTLLLGVAMVAVLSLVVRYTYVNKALPWVDIGTVVALGCVLWLAIKRPDWFKPLSWFVFFILLVDILDGVLPVAPPVIRSTHVLLPMLVLYGAFLCDLALTVVALGVVLGICALTWFAFSPLSDYDMMMLFNVILVAVISGLTSLGIWMHHWQLMKELRQQAEKLQFELEINSRLDAVIFHDVVNLLSALTGLLGMAEMAGEVKPGDLALMNRMAGRIGAIIETARNANANCIRTMESEVISTDHMVEELREVFGSRLQAKGQSLELVAGAGLTLRTIPGVLLNTVLGNLVSNAIKFSPKGGVIRMSAMIEGAAMRIEIRDEGTGFPARYFEKGGGSHPVSVLGTDGERGHGVGLSIIAVYVSKLGGVLEIMNRADGASASVVLSLNPE